jgi:hypothetical protein
MVLHDRVQLLERAHRMGSLTLARRFAQALYR